jgi:hypothetical protein
MHVKCNEEFDKKLKHDDTVLTCLISNLITRSSKVSWKIKTEFSPRECCKFVNRGLAPASCIFFFVSASANTDGQAVSIYGCISIDILILVYRVYNLIFYAPITNGSNNYPKINKGVARAPPSPLQHTPGSLFTKIIIQYMMMMTVTSIIPTHAFYILLSWSSIIILWK